MTRGKLVYDPGLKQRPAQASNYRIEMPPLVTTYITEIGGLSLDAKSVEVPLVGIANGMSDRVPGTVTFNELTLKRPFRFSERDFYDWIQQVRDESDPEKYVTTGTIELLTNDMKSVLSKWTIEGAWPSKWSIGGMAAGKDDMLIEELTVQVEFVKREKAS